MDEAVSVLQSGGVLRYGAGVLRWHRGVPGGPSVHMGSARHDRQWRKHRCNPK